MTVKINNKLIKELRLRNSYSQEKLAEIAGVNLRTIQRIEKDGLASLRTIAALANAFGVKPEDLDVSVTSNDLEMVSVQCSKLFPAGITISITLFIVGVLFASQIGNIYTYDGSIGIGMRGLIGFALLFLSFVLLARNIDLKRWRPYIIFVVFLMSQIIAPMNWVAQILVILPVWVIFEISLITGRIRQRRMANSPT
jgi:transcriptional regulator with XRE-family HTH domain